MKIISFIIISLIFISCDCQYHISGIVVDAETKAPINNVTIGKTDSTDLDNPFNKKTYTKSNGQYEILGIGGSCKDITMYFSKENFETQKTEIRNNSNDTIYLKKHIITNNKELEGKIQTIEMEYFGWVCPCPQWITPKNKSIYIGKQKGNENYLDLFYYIEPSSKEVVSPFELTENMDNLHFKFIGRFYKEKQYSFEEGEQTPATTFQYDKVELITK